MNAAPEGELHPWLLPAWERLQAHVEGGRLPQALLIHGPSGLGKAALAERFAHRLLCTGAGTRPCGRCAGCHLLAAGTHPDYRRIAPEEPGKPIRVDAIRRLIGDLALKAQYEGYRVSLIERAEQMNVSSANALLKTLEEPAEHNLIILVAEAPSRLPPTILSRCQKIAITPPTAAEAAHWLSLRQPGIAADTLLNAAGGSPLRALALADSDVVERRRRVFEEFRAIADQRQDPVVVAERWHGLSHEECLDWMLSWLPDLIRLAVGASPRRVRNADVLPELQWLAAGLGPRGLLNYWRELLALRQALGTQANRQLLLEETLIRWSRLGSRHG